MAQVHIVKAAAVEERISALEGWISDLEAIDFERDAEGARDQALESSISP